MVTEPVAGDLFALLCEDVWCRVKVLSVNGPTINVFFVDHGDTAETTKSELRILAPQFQQLPLQVRDVAVKVVHGLACSVELHVHAAWSYMCTPRGVTRARRVGSGEGAKKKHKR